jgi:uncharacterized protein
MPRQIVVSVHDATPAHEARLRRIFELLSGWGIARTSILVIPRYHGGWNLRDHPDFVSWLRGLEREGHEIVLHGLEHADAEPGKGTLVQRILRRTYSREGEFYTLTYKAAADRLRRGLAAFGEVGFRPAGFVSPAWMHNDEVLRAVRDAGLRYATSLWAFLDLEAGRVRKAPAVCYSPRKRRTAVASALYASALSRVVAGDDLVRVAIHPGDVARPVIVRSLARVLRRLAGGRTQSAYRDLLASP